VLFGGLLIWQAWMTLTLFAPPRETGRVGIRQAWRRLRDDRPVVSGRHPLHLYFGYLGAEALAERSTLCCYDPAFQAGFPKTPVFDSGSRPAELFLYLAGSKYSPAAYKKGLAACCLLVPLLLALAAWALRLRGAVGCLCVALGLLVWWGTPCQEALAEGDLDLLLACLAGLAHVCLLADFDRRPGAGTWLGLFLTGCIGWFAHPFFFLLLGPLVLVYYLSAGPRHEFGWHGALFGSLLGALGVNAFWLIDWARYWWIRLPFHFGAPLLKHRTIQTFWNAVLWGDAGDRALWVALFGLAAVGVVLLNQHRQRPAARLLGMGAGGFGLLAAVGIAWPPLGALGTSSLLLPALWFAVPPAVYALQQLFHGLRCGVGCRWRAAGVSAVLLLGLGFAGRDYLDTWTGRCLRATPLAVGLGPERTELVETLRALTGPEARILWEDRPGKREAPRWGALLPLLTERAFVGGLAPDACIEHAHADLCGQALAGRPMADWTDAELDDYCRRYNVGWAVCWSPPVVARFRAWKGEPAATVADEGTGYMFALRPRSFVLKGQARWVGADRGHITLADVVPEDGVVVLSLHYQAGLQASPARVQVEREPDAFDPIPFVRLRVPGPLALVTLTWEGN
jgi:hypothetical protein